MVVVAGPSGSGKSTFFPVAETGLACFNVDDRCAELQGGSYRQIPPEIRAQAQQERRDFIETCTRELRSFAVETTLRTNIAIQQAGRAKAAGFRLEWYSSLPITPMKTSSASRGEDPMEGTAPRHRGSARSMK
jgi:predicted ABC-type ATPase